MPNICRANIDTAGGTILQGSSTVFLDGFPIALEGDPVQSHGIGEHNSAKMINGLATVIVDGKPICIEGVSKASCGHTAISSSSGTAG